MAESMPSSTSDRVRPDLPHVVVSGLTSLSEICDLSTASPIPRLPIAGSPREDRHIVALHPGGHDHRRAWPPEQWIRLASLLHEAGFELWLISTPAEQPQLQPLIQACPFLLPVSGDLVHVARRLKETRVLVGIESGIIHLAAAIDLPCVVLWGLPASLPRWRPLGRRLAFLSTQDHAETVFPAIVQLWQDQVQ
jgi:ADP-heptose:LPS heptosyltransferase